jgi:hypothetical protein
VNDRLLWPSPNVFPYWCVPVWFVPAGSKGSEKLNANAFGTRLVIPEDAGMVISGGTINVGNVNNPGVDADALSSAAVVDGGQMTVFGSDVDADALSSAAVVDGGQMTIFGSGVDADALSSAAVVDSEHMIVSGGRVGASVAEVFVDAFEVCTLSGLRLLGLNVRAFAVDAFAIRTLSGLDASINVEALSGLSSAFGINDFRTDCAECMIFFSAKSPKNVGYSRYTDSRNFE